MTAFLAAAFLLAQLPEGPGKDAVVDVCTECHTADRIVAQRHTEEGWTAILRTMATNGARLQSDDTKSIVAYLVKNFGLKKVNVNQATANELSAALGLTATDAEAIVRARATNGPIHSLDELKKIVPKIESAKDQIEF